MMYRKIIYSSLYSVLIFLAGCAGVTQTIEQSSVGIDGIACIGKIEKPPEGLITANDKELLQAALEVSGKGKLCAGKVFSVTQPVTVYRIWNSDKSYTVFGSWWSFELPKGPKQKIVEITGSAHPGVHWIE